MKKIVLILLVLIVMVIPLTSCLQDEVTASSLVPRITTAEASVAKHETRITALETNRVSKAELDSTLSNAKAYTDAKFSAVTTANSYTKLETYTKAEVDQAITNAINAYKASLGATPSSGSGSPTGQVAFTTNPTSLQVLGNGQLCYTMKVTNGLNTWQYVKPIMTISSSTTTTISSVALSYTYAGSSIAHTNVTFSPPLSQTTTTATLVMIPISGGSNNLGEFQIAAGQSVDILVCLQLNTGTAAIWNISHSISSRGI